MANEDDLIRLGRIDQLKYLRYIICILKFKYMCMFVYWCVCLCVHTCVHGHACMHMHTQSKACSCRLHSYRNPDKLG